jgi:gas vesicle protein
MKRNKVRNTVRLLPRYIIGGLIVAAVATVLASQSGDQFRALIRDKSSELKDKMMSTMQETRSRAGDIAQSARDRAEDMVRHGEAEIQSIDLS